MKFKRINVKNLSALLIAFSTLLNCTFSPAPAHASDPILVPDVSVAKPLQADVPKVSTSTHPQEILQKADVSEHTQPESIEHLQASLSEEKLSGIKLLAERLGLPYEELKRRLQINENCFLVPLLDLDEHKNCLIDVFSNANPEYMRYYLDGKLKTPDKTQQVYYTNALYRMWSNYLPRSLNFIIDCDNASIGRIAVGPLYNRGEINAEIGYAIKENYSGKGIVSSAVKTLLNLLQYLLDKGIYQFEKVRATAKADNIASNKILVKNNFVKSPGMVDDGYSPENEYFYHFDKKA